MSALTAHQQRLASLFVWATDATLAKSLARLDELVKTDGGQEYVLSRAWTIDELERRFPAASQAVADAYLAAELEMERTGVEVAVDQVAVLLAHIPA